MKTQPRFKNMRRWGLLVVGSLLGLLNPSQSEPVEGASLGGPSHIGTFEGSTTFTTSSSNGINPGLYLEVMDKYGNYTEYTSEDGVITLPDTQEGAYVTQAKLLGKTKYRDQDTGELLDQWEDGRNLTLESVQMPVLKTTGKNLFNDSLLNGNQRIDDEGKYVSKTTPTVTKTGDFVIDKGFQEKTAYTFMATVESSSWVNIRIVYTDGTSYTVGGWANNTCYKTSDGSKTIDFITFTSGSSFKVYDIYLEKGVNTAPTYEPYKSNILSTSEDVELRGIGDVQDTLDLMTREKVERIGEIVLDGSQSAIGGGYIRINNAISDWSGNDKYLLSDRLPTSIFIGSDLFTTPTLALHGALLYVRGFNSNEEITEYFRNNPTTVQYRLAEESIKTVGLNSTYSFQPVMNREVYISGNILPLVCSVTIPTEPLTFVLNPNAEADQQFIAPDFTITNHTPTSIYLEVSRFEQLTQVLTDVLPEAHDDWSQLDRAQSKEIALGLVPKPSEGWLSLEEGPRYVAADSNYYLGEVKANSSVDFTFTAHHGRAFVEALNPQYRLSFIFDFFDR